MNSQVQKYADNVKYLSFTFSSDQKDDSDILHMCIYNMRNINCANASEVGPITCHILLQRS